MKSDKELTHEESIRLIQGMILTARNRIGDDGFHFLLWGVLVIVASVAQYVWITQGGGNETNLVWMIMPALGIPTAFLYEWKNGKRGKVHSHTDSIYGMVWLGFGIALGLVIYSSVQAKVVPLPYILVVVGLATFLSGCVFKFKPLVIGGVVFWAASVITSFMSPVNQLLLNAVATFMGYIVPGVLLWQNYKRENNV